MAVRRRFSLGSGDSHDAPRPASLEKKADFGRDQKHPPPAQFANKHYSAAPRRSDHKTRVLKILMPMLAKPKPNRKSVKLRHRTF